MGARKRTRAEQRKEEKKTTYYAILRNCPTSPRKMRLVVDLIRGMEVNKALDILKHTQKEAAGRVEKLLLSAIANWQAKNEGVRLEESNLRVSKIFVEQGKMLKRMRPAPQGRGHIIRKRSNHVTLFVDSVADTTDQLQEDTSNNEIQKA